MDESANNPEFQIVYHGSGAKFEAFDYSHMGKGEGAQVYGWGTYVTESEGVGKIMPRWRIIAVASRMPYAWRARLNE